MQHDRQFPAREGDLVHYQSLANPALGLSLENLRELD